MSEPLGIALPIFQGPMGGGLSTPALAAAVSNAGGLGAIGAVGMKGDAIRAVVAAVRERTAKPFALNLWVPHPGERERVADERFARATAKVAPLLEELDVAERPEQTLDPPFEEQLEALLEANPPVYSFVMGVPPRVDEMHRRGGLVIGTATTVEEGLALEAAGIDVVVASGSDAGGHRGSFLRGVDSSLVGTMSLVPQLVDALRVPVVAAGGIADGRGIAASLALGAEGVQIGTAFLACEESGAAPVHRELLGTEAARITRLTRAFTGRPARGIENRLMQLLEAGEAPLPYPLQSRPTRLLSRAAATLGRADLMILWAGQAAALARRGTAGQLVARLVEETDATLKKLSVG